MSTQVLCFTTSLDNLPPVLNCSNWESIFLSIKSECFMFQFVSAASHSLLLMLSLCNLQEKPDSIFPTHSHQLAMERHGIPLSLLFCCMNKPSSQPLLIDHMLQPPAILVNLHWTLMYQSPSWNRGPKTGHGSPNAVSQVLNRGEGSVHLACRLQSR